MKGAAARNIFWGAAISGIGFLALCGWQLYADLDSMISVRMSTELQWASVSPARAGFLSAYELECDLRTGAESDLPKVIDRPFDAVGCAEQLAREKAAAFGLSLEEAISLGQAIKAGVDQSRREAPAPLRWLL